MAGISYNYICKLESIEYTYALHLLRDFNGSYLVPLRSAMVLMFPRLIGPFDAMLMTLLSTSLYLHFTVAVLPAVKRAFLPRHTTTVLVHKIWLI